MSVYTIAQLEKLSNIKAHTIRIWEQRYGLLKPQRTNTNIRTYNDEELKKILNISLLINSGFKISKIASYTEKEVNQILNEILLDQKPSDIYSEAMINKLISSGLEFNELNFDKNISSAISKIGIEEVYIKIIYPMLIRLGIMWSSSEISPGQEHFISNLVKQKLCAAIDSLPIPGKAKRKWILFLPEEEDHELGLLFANFILKRAGHRVIFLGHRVPFESLKTSVQTNKPTDLLFFIVKNQPKFILQKYIKNIEKEFRKTSIFISGNINSFEGLKQNQNIKYITSIDQFYNEIKK